MLKIQRSFGRSGIYNNSHFFFILIQSSYIHTCVLRSVSLQKQACREPAPESTSSQADAHADLLLDLVRTCARAADCICRCTQIYSIVRTIYMYTRAEYQLLVVGIPTCTCVQHVDSRRVQFVRDKIFCQITLLERCY